ncbi:hypothetical protein [Pseudomonas sp. 1928-m]|uniref:DUF7674 family protein n=1 Tax=Pseudomonas sp. 1928-m TaxID=3033804 RepID=UPI0023DEC351|nr:hypothetical protein [Pseudomonas sp. 1928-m]MDF3197029.1 hypothetical protein [Pseudomonas sp. 1928-m]
METIVDLYNVVRDRYPEITEAADRVHVKMWGELDPEFAYSWFESLANALNGDMNKGINASNHMKLFSFFNQALQGCSPEIKNCIDVAFVENLFWQVPSAKAEPYWAKLPASLKELYMGFHNRAPL